MNTPLWTDEYISIAIEDSGIADEDWLPVELMLKAMRDEYESRRAHQYEHRNGETDAPTESGWYWFSGESDGVMHAGLIHVVHGIKHPEAWPTWSDGWSYLSEYQGQWWGPIVPPWRE